MCEYSDGVLWERAKAKRTAEELILKDNLDFWKGFSSIFSVRRGESK